jgi:acetate kinase
MKVLVINSGSSSIKYQLFDMSHKSVLASGIVEKIGESRSCLTHHARGPDGKKQATVRNQPVADHLQGFQLMGEALRDSGSLDDTAQLFGIGHRVVHGGEVFREPALITQEVIETIERLIPLAPLHNPANLQGIHVALQHAPDVPQVAVFDTAFHQSIPVHAFRYAIPQELYEAHHIRRYGFHGSSHYYVVKQAAAMLNRELETLHLISLHLGNGASAAAVRDGRSIDTSMGMTPLEGLIMGTRSGDIDPAIVFYLKRKTGLSRDEVESILNRKSGLKGICGVNDMRKIGELAAKGDAPARLAIEMYCYRIKKYIGAYYAILGRLDAVIFTGGIGENAAFIRAGACDHLTHLGIEMDSEKNQRRPGEAFEIQSEKSPVHLLVIPTNEELEIAEQTVEKIFAVGTQGIDESK